MEFSYTVKIPKERVAVLIGSSGETKRELQQLTKTKIDVDSNEGVVTVSGNDTLKLYELKDVVRAIGRGFNPDIAQLLLKQDCILEVISVLDYVKDKKKHLERTRGRVIGTDGKTREMIEKLTDTFVSVYGKTVSIIGTGERVQIARHAVEALLGGSPHGHVYSFLEKTTRELKKREAMSM